MKLSNSVKVSFSWILSYPLFYLLFIALTPTIIIYGKKFGMEPYYNDNFLITMCIFLSLVWMHEHDFKMCNLVVLQILAIL